MWTRLKFSQLALSLFKGSARGFFFFETTTAAYFGDKYVLFIDRDEDSSRRVCASSWSVGG